jgi:WD40 repeat protein
VPPNPDQRTEPKHRKLRAKHLVVGLLASALLVGLAACWQLFSYFYPWALRETLKGHQGSVRCLAFAADGKTLATGGEDGTIRLWDSDSGKKRIILTGHAGDVLSVAFSPDSTQIASASQDGSVRIWDVETGEQRAVLLGHSGPVLAVAFSPDCKLLASGGADATVRLWELSTENELRVLEHDMEIRALAITSDGMLLVSRTQDGIMAVWDLTGKVQVRRFGKEWFQSPWMSLVLGSDGKTLATNENATDKVVLWDIHTGEPRASLRAEFTWQNSRVESMAITPDGNVLAATTAFGAHMAFWDLSDGHLIGSIYFPPHSTCMAFSPDGRTLATGQVNGSVMLWDSAKLIPR